MKLKYPEAPKADTVFEVEEWEPKLVGLHLAPKGLVAQESAK